MQLITLVSKKLKFSKGAYSLKLYCQSSLAMRTRMTTSKLLRAFFYFSLPILVFAASDCPPGQTEIVGKCYYFSDATELATHGNAMAACEYAKLVSIAFCSYICTPFHA